MIDGPHGRESVVRESVLRVACRRRLFECVVANPGSHLRAIARACGVPLGTTLYHLDRLEGRGMVSVRRDGHFKRYFETDGMGRAEKDLLSALRHAVPHRIAAGLLSEGSATQRELCGIVGVSRSTLSYHVNGLVARGIVRLEMGHQEHRYHLEDAELLSRILGQYRESLGGVEPLRRAPRAPAVGG